MLHESSLDNKIKDELIKYLDEEGRETCSLESDEVRRLFDKSFSYLNKVFNHSGVQSIAHDFARVLKTVAECHAVRSSSSYRLSINFSVIFGCPHEEIEKQCGCNEEAH